MGLVLEGGGGGVRNTLMDEGKGEAEAVRYGRGALGTASVGADDHRVAVVGDVLLDVAF